MLENQVSRTILDRFTEKLREHLEVDVAIVGAGPSGLVAARDLALAGRKVAMFERKLAPGGGVWGGGMLFNEVVVQEDALPILKDFNIRAVSAAADGLYSADAVELASGLIFGALQAGAVIFNSVSVEDIVFKDGRVSGVVTLWTPVGRLNMHVDPLVITARCVLDGTGHPSEIAALASRKAGIRLNTPEGGIMGERPMWVEEGETFTVEHTGEICPGLFVSGMAANNVAGGARMGPIFGGMLKSGRKVAARIEEALDA